MPRGRPTRRRCTSGRAWPPGMRPASPISCGHDEGRSHKGPSRARLRRIVTFDEPLVRGTLVRRYQRFLADVTLESGETVVAHCVNPGSMLGVNASGSEVWLSVARNPNRRL